MNAKIKALTIFLESVTVIIPAALIYFSRVAINKKVLSDSNIFVAAAVVLIVFGVALIIWTIYLFRVIGRGTPVPWAPPRRLVVAGPYRYVRNPMILGILLILAGKAFLFASLPVLAWLLIFFAINWIFFSLFEERSLAERFGDEYLEYKKNVPRLLPRLTPWRSNYDNAKRGV